MKKLRKKIIVLLIILLIELVFPQFAKADETKSITFKDQNLYYIIKEQVTGNYDDSTLTINMNSSAIELVTSLTIRAEQYMYATGIEDLSGLENFTKLSDLDIYNSNITNLNNIPSENLTRMHIENCPNISDYSALSKLSNMRSLQIVNGNITDIPNEIFSMNSLYSLDLSDNKIENISEISNLKNLSTLKLSNNKIKDISALTELDKLTSVELNENQIKDISQIENLKQLTSISLSDNGIEDISSIGNLTSLSSLNLDNNEISDISVLQNLKNLNYLYLNNNDISNIDSIAIGMNTLELSGNKISDFSKFQDTIKNNIKIDSQLIEINANPGETVELPQLVKQAMESYEATSLDTTNCTVSSDNLNCTIDENVDFARIQIIGGNLEKSIIYINLNNDTENVDNSNTDIIINKKQLEIIGAIFVFILIIILIITFVALKKKSKKKYN